MTPVLGPPTPGSASGNHPAVLVATTAGLAILDTGPPRPARPESAWCDARVTIPGIPHPVWFTSVHLPPKSGTSQRIYAERLACLNASRGGLAVIGGDFNSYAPADHITRHALEQLPVDLRPARMRHGPGGLEPDYRVHQALAATGLADAAAELPPGRRTPPQLTPTGITGGARADRIYVSTALVPALTRYEQAATGGSDHQALLLTLAAATAAGVTPPPPLP